MSKQPMIKCNEMEGRGDEQITGNSRQGG